jgi:hypothetical protein
MPSWTNYGADVSLFAPGTLLLCMSCAATAGVASLTRCVVAGMSINSAFRTSKYKVISGVPAAAAYTTGLFGTAAHVAHVSGMTALVLQVVHCVLRVRCCPSFLWLFCDCAQSNAELSVSDAKQCLIDHAAYVVTGAPDGVRRGLLQVPQVPCYRRPIDRY